MTRTFGSTFRLLAVLAGGLTLFNLAVTAFDFGVAQLIEETSQYFNFFVGATVRPLFELAGIKLSTAAANVLTLYSIFVLAGFRLNNGVGPNEGGNEWLFTGVAARVYNSLIGYPLMTAFPAFLIYTTYSLAIDPIGFVLEVPTRLGVLDDQASWIIGLGATLAAFLASLGQFWSTIWTEPSRRSTFLAYLREVAIVLFTGALVIVVNSGTLAL